MFARILNAFRNTPATRTAEQTPRFGVEAMESRMMMSVTATGGTFTLTFNGQTTAAAGDSLPLEEVSFNYSKITYRY